MDKEAQEKIAIRRLPDTTLCDCRHSKAVHHLEEGACDSCGCTWYHPNIIVIDMLKAGYLKLPEGEPPLLSDKESASIWQTGGVENSYLKRRIAQAQRDSDIKWMRGE